MSLVFVDMASPSASLSRFALEKYPRPRCRETKAVILLDQSQSLRSLSFRKRISLRRALSLPDLGVNAHTACYHDSKRLWRTL